MRSNNLNLLYPLARIVPHGWVVDQIGVGPMLDASTLGSDPAKYREVAETLRGIAHGVGLDQV